MTGNDRLVDLDAPIGVIRPIIGDVARAAGCLPGLSIGKALDARTFAVVMSVPIGLLTMRYRGTLSVGNLEEHTRPIRFRVEGVAPGGLLLAVAIEIAAVARTEAATRLTIVNEITLDATTTLLAGPSIALVGGMLLDGFGRNLKMIVGDLAAARDERSSPPGT